MANKGFLLVTMHAPPAFEEEFNAWYDTEHLPERLGVSRDSRPRCASFVCPVIRATWRCTTWRARRCSTRPSTCGSRSRTRARGRLRVLQRVRVYRAAGLQIYPGTALTGRSPRVQLLRFRSRPQARRRRSLRDASEFRGATRDAAGACARVRGSGRYRTDFLGFVEQRAPSATSSCLKPSVCMPMPSIW